MWYASIVGSPRLVFTQRPPLPVNIKVVCMYFRRSIPSLAPDEIETIKFAGDFKFNLKVVWKEATVPVKRGVSRT